MRTPSRERWHYFVGVDLGKRRDYTAVVVVEQSVTVFPGERDWVTYECRREQMHWVRFVERMPRGLLYTAVVGRLGRILRSPELAGRCTVVMDATGVGEAVVDLARAEQAERPHWAFVPVTITGAGKAHAEGRQWRVPKQDLMEGLVVMLERGSLRIPGRLRGRQTLLEELRQARVKVSASGRRQYGAWGPGEHDDLTMALALACWRADTRAAATVPP